MRTQPYLSRLKYVLHIGLLWSPICFLAVFVHKSVVSADWINSAVFLIFPMIIELFICLGIRFICRISPIHIQTFLKGIFTHLVAMIILAGGWIVIIMVYSSMLESFTSDHLWKTLFIKSIPLLAVMSVTLYCFSVLIHYLILANQAARKAENDALNQRLYAVQAELKVLKNTIHPHFLFNSLNSIGPLIKKSPDKAKQFIENLSDFFRYSLKYSGEKIVLVQEELEHIENYLRIEAIRFGKRLKIKMDIEKKMLKKSVLSLILLPLVENAIKHGISQCLDGGLLTISVCSDGDYISIEVINPREKLVHPVKGAGLGIRTLQQRLRFYYGSSAQFIINKGETEFSVKLLIPQEMEKENVEKNIIE